jgi:cobalt-zinc-cadmium efflux system protein
MDDNHHYGIADAYDHTHTHAPKDFGRAFPIGVALNSGFVIIEAIFGFLANSTALLADAGHNLSDVLGLLIAWAAASLSKNAPTSRYTYGLRSSSILAALFNAMFLLVAVGAIGLEAAHRLANPAPIAGVTVIVVAVFGILFNGLTAWLFSSGRGRSRREPCHLRGDRVEHMGSFDKLYPHVIGCCSHRFRAACGARIS